MSPHNASYPCSPGCALRQWLSGLRCRKTDHDMQRACPHSCRCWRRASATGPSAPAWVTGGALRSPDHRDREDRWDHWTTRTTGTTRTIGTTRTEGTSRTTQTTWTTRTSTCAPHVPRATGPWAPYPASRGQNLLRTPQSSRGTPSQDPVPADPGAPPDPGPTRLYSSTSVPLNLGLRAL